MKKIDSSMFKINVGKLNKYLKDKLQDFMDEEVSVKKEKVAPMPEPITPMPEPISPMPEPTPPMPEPVPSEPMSSASPMAGPGTPPGDETMIQPSAMSQF